MTYTVRISNGSLVLHDMHFDDLDEAREVAEDISSRIPDRMEDIGVDIIENEETA